MLNAVLDTVVVLCE